MKWGQIIKNSRHILTFSCSCLFPVSLRKWSLEDSSRTLLTPSRWQRTPPRGMEPGANPNWWWPKGQVSTRIDQVFVGLLAIEFECLACGWRVPNHSQPAFTVSVCFSISLTSEFYVRYFCQIFWIQKHQFSHPELTFAWTIHRFLEIKEAVWGTWRFFTDYDSLKNSCWIIGLSFKDKIVEANACTIQSLYFLVGTPV